MTELDKEFEESVEKINAKLAEAAKALHEAAELAGKAGLPMLIRSQFISEELQYRNRYAAAPKSRDEISAETDQIFEKLEHIDVSDIEDAMSACGWNPSSSYC